MRPLGPVARGIPLSRSRVGGVGGVAAAAAVAATLPGQLVARGKQAKERTPPRCRASSRGRRPVKRLIPRLSDTLAGSSAVAKVAARRAARRWCAAPLRLQLSGGRALTRPSQYEACCAVGGAGS
eukprot:360512-Chlamydomonas_euryale.AAC.6